jgi:hypothetical protein
MVGETKDEESRPFIESIRLVTPSREYPLHRKYDVNDSELRSLAQHALRWTYVLRSRERWLLSATANEQHAADAIATLNDFGLTQDDVAQIAVSRMVVVKMPFASGDRGWEGRILPWEYVLSAATRKYRADVSLVVTRHLVVSGIDEPQVAHVRPTVLYVESAPSPFNAVYTFESERRLVRDALQPDDSGWSELINPTLDRLRSEVATLRPDIIHLAGFDNYQGAQLLRTVAGPDARIETPQGVQTTSDFINDERGFLDGYMMSGQQELRRVVTAEELSQALCADQHRPFLVSFNLYNSAARSAPLALAQGALAAIAFQDTFNDDLAEYFYRTLYEQLRLTNWHLPMAFSESFERTRNQPEANQATGLVLWTSATAIDSRLDQQTRTTSVRRRDVHRTFMKERVAPARDIRKSTGISPEPPCDLQVEPFPELNYAVLHNKGRLFKSFIIHRRASATGMNALLSVRVEAHLGNETACFHKQVTLDSDRKSLSDEIHVPLTAALARSVREAVFSSLFVEVVWNETVLYRETHRLRLLPIDQWRDNERDGKWLPSFVQPRDPAIIKALQQAQRYVRVIRDDPAAGFEGYQSADPEDPPSLDTVDLQVRAIWSSLLHEWQLGYINPPPTYSDAMDSQRLRTPSTVLADCAGTCIDLALLFAACLELVDIYPVIFLLDGHALPGYWRHHKFQSDFQTVRVAVPEDVVSADASWSTASGAQYESWQVGKPGYKEIRQHIRAGHLVPLETVRLTEHAGFGEAIDAGMEALSVADDFHSMLDIVTARFRLITPLPIDRGQA